MASLFDDIVEADDLDYEDVTVPEWKGRTVRIQSMTGTDRDAYDAKSVALKNQGKDVELRLQDFRSKLVAKCMLDPETGERVFSDKQVHKLGRKNSRVIDRLHAIAHRLSGMSKEAKEAAKGNSEPGQNDASISD